MSIHKACKPVLVAYATREGQTRKIAEHVAATLRARNFEVDVVDVGSDEPVELPFYCAAILLASLHLRKHEREMTAFAKTNHDVLARMPTAFLSVSLAEAGAEDSSRSPALRAEAATGVREAIDAFVAETKLHPAHVHPVAGALLYKEYGAIVRLVMRAISKRAGGPTDTSRDYELTDWLALDRFVDEIAEGLPRGEGSRTA